MNRLSSIEPAVFISFLYSLFPKDLTIQNLFTIHIFPPHRPNPPFTPPVMGLLVSVQTPMALTSALQLDAVYPKIWTKTSPLIQKMLQKFSLPDPGIYDGKNEIIIMAFISILTVGDLTQSL